MTSWLRAVLCIAVAVQLSGCAHFFVEERTLDAYAAVPRAERKPMVVRADGATDGRPALIRVSEARLEPVTSGTRRRVRVFRPMTVVGITLVATGVAWIGAGLIDLFVNQCDVSNDSCLGIRVTSGSLMAGFGGLEVLTGSILAGVGAGGTEVHDLGGRLKELRP